MLRRCFVLALALASVVVMPLIAQANTEVVDQSQPFVNEGANGGFFVIDQFFHHDIYDPDMAAGQTFRAGISGMLTRVRLHMFVYGGNEGDLTIQIRTVDSDGLPTTTILSSVTVPPGVVTTPAWYSFSFSEPAQVEAGNVYAIVATVSHRNDGHSPSEYEYEGYAWSLDMNQPYPSGNFVNYWSWRGVWLEWSGDTSFETYVIPRQQTSAEAIHHLTIAVETMAIKHDVKQGLLDKLAAAHTSASEERYSATCGQMHAFMKQVQAQRGKALTAIQADQLTSDATSIRSLIGC